MLDLNHILLFIACVSPLVLLAQTWKRSGSNHSWRLSAISVLIVSGIAWILRPSTAGFIGGGAWLVLLLVPAVGLRKAAELAGEERFAMARRLTYLLRFLHPGDDVRRQSELLRALEVTQRGDLPSALELLARLQNNNTSVGRQATAQSFRIRGDWAGLLTWIREELPREILQIDRALLPLYFRALGETGARDELLREFASRTAETDPPQTPSWIYNASLLVVLAFCGRVAPVTRLLATKARHFPGEMKKFWREKVERVNSLELSPTARELLQRIEQLDRHPARVFSSKATRPTRAVLILIALNLAMFGVEMTMGGSTNPSALHRLGQLEISAVRFQGEYWRLFTALFLHYGPLHLVFNLYALFVIGPGLEEAIGSVRFTICYLLSGLTSSIGVLFLRMFGLTSAEQLVGASGCIMGLVGVWAGLLLRDRRSPLAARRLKNIFLIIVMQTAFDLSTPQISMAAHLSGLVSGLALGLILAPRRRRV